MENKRENLQQILDNTPDLKPQAELTPEEITGIEEMVDDLRTEEFGTPNLMNHIEGKPDDDGQPKFQYEDINLEEAEDSLEAIRSKYDTPDLNHIIEKHKKVERSIDEKDMQKKLKSLQEEPKAYMEGAPALSLEEFLTPEGEHLDFSRAKTFSELISMIEDQEVLTNQLGEEIPVDVIISQIYERIYRPHGDWTKITLRHRLREMVYQLRNTIDQTDYANNLPASEYLTAKNIEELKDILANQILVDENNKTITGAQAILAIDNGRYDLLPKLLKYKVVSLSRVAPSEVANKKTNSFKEKLSGTWNSFTSWFKTKK